MAWMYWTLPTALFFTGIAAMLVGMTIWQLRAPSRPRRGLLPFATTRGDRLFIGLLAAAFVNLTWVALTDATQWIAVALAAVAMAAIARWA